MNKIIKSVVVSLIIMLTSACTNNAWEELPTTIVSFIEEYFPAGEVQSYTEKGDSFTVQIKNGATLKFDRNYAWMDVNGNGESLPGNFLYDRLPDELYGYIESIESAGYVYRVRRHSRMFDVLLADDAITYDEITGTITYSVGSD